MRIPADVRAIAAVVVGGRRIHLEGEARRLAVSAMHALGYSRTHMAWVLKTRPQRVTEVANRLGILLHHHDQRPDPIAVQFVCEGIPMPLTGADRDEVVRRLGPTKTAEEIGQLVGSKRQTISVLASRLGVHTNAGRPTNRAA
jgi:hypothetical protein